MSDRFHVADPFPDPEWDEWASKSDLKEDLDEFYRRLNEITYADEDR